MFDFCNDGARGLTFEMGGLDFKSNPRDSCLARCNAVEVRPAVTPNRFDQGRYNKLACTYNTGTGLNNI